MKRPVKNEPGEVDASKDDASDFMNDAIRQTAPAGPGLAIVRGVEAVKAAKVAPAEADTITLTPSELDARLAEVEAEVAARFPGYEGLKARAAEGDALDVQLAQTRFDQETLTTQLAAATDEQLRLRVVLSLGLPADLVDRIKGTNEQELVDDAQTLLKQLESLTKPEPTPRDWWRRLGRMAF